MKNKICICKTDMYEELRQALTDGDGYLDLEVVSSVGKILQRVRKQAILDVIEALEMETQGDAELLLIMGDAYRTLVEQVCFEEGFNRAIKVLSFRIAKLKEREGL